MTFKYIFNILKYIINMKMLEKVIFYDDNVA